MGKCISEADGAAFPVVMAVQYRDMKTFTGEVQWPTLDSAKTKFRGTIQGDTLTWEEYEAIQSPDSVELPMKYSAKIEGNKIKGNVVHEEEEMQSVIELEKFSTAPSKELDLLKSGTKWGGICYVPYPFVFEITKRQRNQIEGTVTWPELQDAQTKAPLLFII
jgi:hypothetical protein